eukprot:150357_1
MGCNGDDGELDRIKGVGSMESSMISWQRIPWSASSWRRVAFHGRRWHPIVGARMLGRIKEEETPHKAEDQCNNALKRNEPDISDDEKEENVKESKKKPKKKK